MCSAFYFGRSRNRKISDKVELTQTFRQQDKTPEQNNGLVKLHSSLIQLVCSLTHHKNQLSHYHQSLCSWAGSSMKFAGRMFLSLEQEKILIMLVPHWLLRNFPLILSKVAFILMMKCHGNKVMVPTVPVFKLKKRKVFWRLWSLAVSVFTFSVHLYLRALFSLSTSLFYTFRRPGWNGSRYNCHVSGWKEKGDSYPAVRLCICPRAAGQGPHCKQGESWKLKVQWQAFSSQWTQNNSLLSCSQFPQGSSAHINYLFSPCSTLTVLAELQYLLPDCSWLGRVAKRSALLSPAVLCVLQLTATCTQHGQAALGNAALDFAERTIQRFKQ